MAASCIGFATNYYGSVELQRPPSHKVIRRRPPLLLHVRGSSEIRERSSLQLLADLESHVSEPGKQYFASLRNTLCLEKKIEALEKHALEKEIETRKLALEKEIETREQVQALEKHAHALEKMGLEKDVAHLTEKEVSYQLQILALKGLKNTRGLLELLQEVLLASIDRYHLKGSIAWEAILRKNEALRDCIQKCTNLKDEVKQAAQCHAMYSVLSQHVHAGKELAELQASKGQISFHRGPLTAEQVKILLCLGKAANLDIVEG